MNTLYIALVVAVVGPVILSWITGRQRKTEKEQDYARQDAVALEAKRQQDEVAAQVAKDQKILADRQDEVAKQAEGVAKLLLAAQTKTTLETDEVARLAATAEGIARGSQIIITLSHPNGNRQNVLLSEVPRVGEDIRLSNGAEAPWLVVDHVLWVEGTDPPHVIVSVHPRLDEAPASLGWEN
jgi:hypothetical protein